MNLHSTASTLRLGEPLATAQGALILVHGRGGSAEEIAGLAKLFEGHKFAFLAPEATGNTWYPERFLAPTAENEPWLSSALDVLTSLVSEVRQAGIPAERLGLIGFSQGACLVLEYVFRNPLHYGLVGGLSGALIGPAGLVRPQVDLDETPVLLGCAESDPHIPRSYVEHTAELLERSGAKVDLHLVAGSAHTIFAEEVAWLREHGDRLSAN